MYMKYSKELIYPLLERYEGKEASRAEVCMDTGMSQGTFWYWLRKYRSEQREEISFIELKEGHEISRTEMEIYLGDGRILIRGDIDMGQIRKLVGAESI